MLGNEEGQKTAKRLELEKKAAELAEPALPRADIRLVRLPEGDHCQDRSGCQAVDHGVSGAGQALPGVAGRCQIMKQLSDFRMLMPAADAATRSALACRHVCSASPAKPEFGCQ